MTEPTSFKDWISVDIGYGIDARREAHDMYMTVKRLDLVEWIKNYQGGYCEERNRISQGLEENNHSGYSFGATLRLTRQVFKDGWSPKYKNNDMPE